jgi:hypothetical protein
VPGGTAIANSATVPIGAGGRVCLYTSSATNLIADINGYHPAGSTFTTTTPTRLLDTRPSRVGQATVTEVQITGRAGVPANASAVVLNLTALDSSTAGFVTAYACGSPLPDVSNLNYVPGGTAIANSATVPIGAGGKVCLYTSSATNLIADINGYHPAGSTFITTTPSRLLDTRSAPAGQFVETFTSNTGLERFDTGIYHRGDNANGVSAWPGAATWPGDHDLNCGAPDTTQRTIHRANKSESFYLCRDHLMTSIGDTDGYSTGWFEPRQTFSNVTQVSWDANVTDLGGRQWWEMSIVPASFNSGVPTCPHCSAHPDVASVAGLPSYPTGSTVISTIARGLHVSTDGVDRRVAEHYQIRNFDPEAAASKSIRRPFSVTDNRNGTLTVNFGGFRTFTVPGAFPAGAFRVVFKDHNYTPDKDGIPIGYTWHWDNIAIR